MSSIQTLRFRKPTTNVSENKEGPKAPAKHSGILQDQLRRSAKPPWTPSLSVAFRVLLLLRFSAGVYSTIQDCDEVYNFWEPLHFSHHGYGFQTWELSPAYAIRSWSYILLHLAPLKLFSKILSLDKRAQFFALRALFAFVTSFCEAKFYRAVVEHIQIRVGRYMFFMMLFSAGMWSATPAFLPSTFTLYTNCLAFSYAFQPTSMRRSRRVFLATLWFACGAIIGWPFAIAIAIPFVVEELFVASFDKVGASARTNWQVSRFIRFIECCLAAATIAIPCVFIDSYAYGRLAVVPWNIVRYNVFGGANRGPDLYGTSPWYFYVLNLFLNFNFVALAALAALPSLAITYVFDRKRLGPKPAKEESSPFTVLLLRLSPFYAWFLILSLQAHKEERFMYPVYHLVCFNAATTLYLARGWLEVAYIKATSSPYRASRSSLFAWFTRIFLVLTTLLSASRIFAITRYYHAPLDVATHFQGEELPRLLDATGLLPPPPPKPPGHNEAYDEKPAVDLSPIKRFNLTLCIGKEWYRFPGHYLIPTGVNVQFIKSDFDGLLPGHFIPSPSTSLLSKVTQTRLVPENLNDLNREEPSHYVDVTSCDYLMDLDSVRDKDHPSSHEKNYSRDNKNWDRTFCTPFLDASQTPLLQRLLWIPGNWWRKKAVWVDYCLLKNVRRSSERERKKW